MRAPKVSRKTDHLPPGKLVVMLHPSPNGEEVLEWGLMGRNYGIGARDQAKAAAFALRAEAQAKRCSFSTAATVADRYAHFARWGRDHQARYMEYVTPAVVRAYGQQLAERVAAGKMSTAYAQNLVSAVNTVMRVVTRGAWEPVRAVQECGIPRRCTVRQDAPGGLDREAHSRAVDQVRDQVGERAAAVLELARELGLRSKEASLIDARSALAEAKQRQSISVIHGTKGGLERVVPITTPQQIAALERAAQVQGNTRAVMPGGQDWRTWREGDLRDAREITQRHTTGGLHDLRSAYACERYQALVGRPAPVEGGTIVDRAADEQARLVIAKELGHGRIDVVRAYIGGRV